MTGVNFADLLNEAGPDGGEIPDGVYDAQVEQAEAKIASTGKPMVVARFRILTGPHANRVVVNNFVISQGNPNALRFFFQHMAVFGMNRDYFSTPGLQLEQVALNLIGRQARLTLGTKDGRQNVNRVEPVPGGALSAAPTPQVAAPQVAPPAPAINYTQVGAPPLVPAAAPAVQPQVLTPNPVLVQEPAPAVQPIAAPQQPAAPPEIPF